MASRLHYVKPSLEEQMIHADLRGITTGQLIVRRYHVAWFVLEKQSSPLHTEGDWRSFLCPQLTSQ